MKIGIDFGTTNSSVAWFNPQTQRVENILFDNKDARVPSLVYWDKDPTKRYFGYCAAKASDDAEKEANIKKRMDFQHHLATSFKTDFANGRPCESLNMGEPISSEDIVREYLSWLMNEIREKTNTPAPEPISATLTYPTTVEWDNRGEGGPAYRLKRIAEEVGFVNVEIMREPEAAFREAKRRNIELGNGVLVFDLGGGTLDLVYYKCDENGEFSRPSVSGQGRSGIAGDAFDKVVIELLDEQVRHDSNNAINISHVVAAKGRARYAKEELSDGDEVSVALATDNVQCRSATARITKDVFELRADSTFEQIKNELARYVEKITNQSAPLDSVLLIGGSTNIPKIYKMVKDVTRAKCIRPPDADFYVALGAVDIASCEATTEESQERTDVPNPLPYDCKSARYLEDLRKHVFETFAKLLSYSKWRGKLYAFGVPCDLRASLITRLVVAAGGVPLWKLRASTYFDTKKLYNAKETLGLASKEKETGTPEICLVQGDSTILGGGREGFLCTELGIYMKLADNSATFVEWGKDLTFHVRDDGFFVKQFGVIKGSADMYWHPFQLHELVTALSNLCAWITMNRPIQI